MGDEYRWSGYLRCALPPLPKWQPPPFKLAPLPTVRICGVDVHVSKWLPKDWLGVVDGQVLADSVETATEVLGRIVWTSPPCYMTKDGRIIDATPPPPNTERGTGGSFFPPTGNEG